MARPEPCAPSISGENFLQTGRGFWSGTHYAVTAPQGRTGKTHLVHLIIIFGIGHIPVPTAGGSNTEEMGKRIETAAHSGRPYIHFNNLPNGMVLESDALCQISTEGGFVFRTLGKHDEGF